MSIVYTAICLEYYKTYPQVDTIPSPLNPTDINLECCAESFHRAVFLTSVLLEPVWQGYDVQIS